MFDTFVTKETVDTSVLDQVFKIKEGTTPVVEEKVSAIFNTNSPEKVLEEATKQHDQVAPVENAGNIKDVLAQVDAEITPVAEETTTETTPETGETKGRPKTDKNTMVAYLKSKVDTQDFGVPSDYDVKVPLEDYLSKLPEDKLISILESNWTTKEAEIRESAPQQFYEALDEEAKMVAQYAAYQGPKDWKSFFSSLAATEEVRQLDPNNEEHHIPIVKSYLSATTQMTPGQIDEQVEDWKDNGKLDKKALEFKAPLDTIQKQRTDILIQKEEEKRQYNIQLANFYADHVYKALETNELAGVKLDKKFAKQLANDMCTTAPSPWDGRPVNYLGYGLDKCQYVEPNYQAVAIAAWILNDFDSAMKALSQGGANKATEEAVKLIKLNQGIASTGNVVATEVKQVKRLPDNSRVLKRTA